MKTAKKFLKLYLPSLYNLMIKLLTSRPVRYVLYMPKRVQMARVTRRPDRELAIDLNGKMGMGAMLSHVVNILYHADRLGLRPSFRFSNPLYTPPDFDPGSDWLPEYFVVRRLVYVQDAKADVGAPQPIRFVRLRSSLQLTRVWHDEMTVREAHELFFRHFDFSEDILQAAESFVGHNFANNSVLGVHYRGTDKMLEAPRVEWGLVKREVEALLRARPSLTRVFVMSDEREFMDYMKSWLGAKMLAYECREVFYGNQPVHSTEGDRRQKATEALTLILILSRCNVCLRSASHLSAWAKIIRPELEVIMLEPPTGSSNHFPDSSILAEGALVALAIT